MRPATQSGKTTNLCHYPVGTARGLIPVTDPAANQGASQCGDADFDGRKCRNTYQEADSPDRADGAEKLLSATTFMRSHNALEQPPTTADRPVPQFRSRLGIPLGDEQSNVKRVYG